MPTGIYQHKPHTEETIIKLRKAKIGNKNPMFGKHPSKETMEKIRKARKGKKRLPFSEEWKNNIRKSHKGKNLLEKHKNNISKALIGKQPKNSINWKGKNHPNWKNGISFEPYGLEFNENLKEVIRNRDRRKCFICEKTELENKEKITVHHIDYNKRNNDPNNLISLCKNCHIKTNYNREYWTNYFKSKIIK